MIRSSLLLACLLACGVTSSSSMAQQVALNEHQTRIVERNFAKCVVELHKKQARAVVLSDATEAEISRKFASLIDGRCLVNDRPDADPGGMMMKFAGESFLLALANALVVKDFPTDREWNFPPDPQPAQPAVHQLKGPFPQAKPGEKQITGIAWLGIDRDQFAECVSRKDPHGVHRLLLTVPDSAEEAASFGALQKVMPDCLNGQLTFTRNDLRGWLAAAFYRLATASASLPPGN